jgi:hypothetical protein
MSQPYGQQPGDFNQAEGYGGGMPPAPPEYTSGPVARPGTVTAAAVLAFVQAGLTLICTIFVMVILGAVTDASNDSLAGFEIDSGMLALMWVVAIAGLVGAGLLIWAGVKSMSGTAGNLMLIATGLQIVLCIVWLVQGAPIALVFAVMPVISLVLALGGPAKQYEASKRG